MSAFKPVQACFTAHPVTEAQALEGIVELAANSSLLNSELLRPIDTIVLTARCHLQYYEEIKAVFANDQAVNYDIDLQDVIDEGQFTKVCCLAFTEHAECTSASVCVLWSLHAMVWALARSYACSSRSTANG